MDRRSFLKGITGAAAAVGAAVTIPGSGIGNVAEKLPAKKFGLGPLKKMVDGVSVVNERTVYLEKPIDELPVLKKPDSVYLNGMLLLDEKTADYYYEDGKLKFSFTLAAHSTLQLR